MTKRFQVPIADDPLKVDAKVAAPWPGPGLAYVVSGPGAGNDLEQSQCEVG